MNDWFTVFLVENGKTTLVATFLYQNHAETFLHELVPGGYMSKHGRILKRKNVDI